MSLKNQGGYREQTIYWRPPSSKPLRSGQVLIRFHSGDYVTSWAIKGEEVISGSSSVIHAWAFLPSTESRLSFDLED